LADGKFILVIVMVEKVLTMVVVSSSSVGSIDVYICDIDKP
jgi:hypothetical protein